jgi:hypothetical protein
MGIYNGSMYTPIFPITLPKICSFFELRLSPNFKTDEDVILTVMKGAEKVTSITMPSLALDNTIKLPHGKPIVGFLKTAAMEFPSMTFDEPTLLEVIAQIDGQSVVAGRLWVTTYP